MKTIEVVAAIIRKDCFILATQRGYGDYEGGWEFPGGKIETNETPENALIREISEELKMEITIDSFIMTVEHDYENFHLIMHCFLCASVDNEFELVEHTAAKWLSFENLDSVNWLPADEPIVKRIKELELI